ncbi:uncharacterized protein BP5553_03015 [Venustampulla echinocandica]|uniref:Ankyrin n=1 Tax=Venustampulla echinocandica TaxID=2656787 RepID=A0A370TT19_9HELO|nr:uncharacterized protein BP5553_03015 [Venustampulla echinocandica]RDL38675.1 hypothetical protein BP5553_03015 [Venustampulla echinocandica]
MSSSRAPKWDWASHIPKMIDLYHQRMSIPDIREAIACEGFEPSLSSVYSKFRSMNYPTDPVARTKLLDETLPCPRAAQVGYLARLNEPSPYQPSYFDRSGLCSVPEDGYLVEHAKSESWRPSGEVPPVPQPEIEHFDFNDAMDTADDPLKNVNLTGDGSIDSSKLPASISGISAEVFPPSWPTSNCDATSQGLGNSADDVDQPLQFLTSALEPDGAAYFDTNHSPSKSEFALHGMANQVNFSHSGDFFLGWEAQPDSPNLEPQLLARIQTPIYLDDATSSGRQAHHSSLRKRTSSDLKSPETLLNGSSAHRSSNSMKKIKSWFAKPSGSSRSTTSHAGSLFTGDTSDSGYATGYTSLSTFEEAPWMNSQSLEEFNGLYRVACSTLHEPPQRKEHWKDIPTCLYCRYSSIHNLGWSARYLKLEVFSSELKLSGVYDLGALDAAGNTALHYAAAGGAGFHHLKALIDAGVDPSIVNTNGETFIHCLRPLHPFTLVPNPDCFSNGDDLIRLLELLQPVSNFDCRDNHGQTILHALALKISDSDLKAKVFKLFRDSGYFPTVLDRFGKSANDVLPLIYDCHGQVVDPNPNKYIHAIEETAEESVILAECGSRHLELFKANKIIEHAYKEPKYIDPDTGDTVVHALSRLNPSDDIISWLEYFVSRDVDLNLHNRQGKYPLISFIGDRPWEESETGATMSKYLDAIIWKNPKERIKNNINVNMRDRQGATALHGVAIRGRPDSTRSLIEAGANVNARADNGLSVLQAAFDALDGAVLRNDGVLAHLLKEVISHLQHAGAVIDPMSLQERGINKL